MDHEYSHLYSVLIVGFLIIFLVRREIRIAFKNKEYDNNPPFGYECASALIEKHKLKIEGYYAGPHHHKVLILKSHNGDILFVSNEDSMSEDILDYFGKIRTDFRYTKNKKVVLR